MVLRIEHNASGALAIPMLHLGWSGRDRRHTGQDAPGIRILHGRAVSPRLESNTARSAELQRYTELGELDSIWIDEPLLTGDLDQDISILNNVA